MSVADPLIKVIGRACEHCGAPLVHRTCPVIVDLDNNTVTWLGGNQHIKLTRQLTELLATLTRHWPNTVHRDLMVRSIWGINEPENAATSLSVLMYRARKQLAAINAPFAPQGVYGLGYVLYWRGEPVKPEV